MKIIQLESLLGLYENRSVWKKAKFFWILAMISGSIGFQSLLWGDKFSSSLVFWMAFCTFCVMFVGVLAGLWGTGFSFVDRRHFRRNSKIVFDALLHWENDITLQIYKCVRQELVNRAKQVICLEKAGFSAQATMEKEQSFRPLFDSAKSLGILNNAESFDGYFNCAEQELKEEELQKRESGNNKGIPQCVAEGGTVASLAGSEEES